MKNGAKNGEKDGYLYEKEQSIRLNQTDISLVRQCSEACNDPGLREAAQCSNQTSRPFRHAALVHSFFGPEDFLGYVVIVFVPLTDDAKSILCC